ncbi:MAG TPA: TonB-dependent receptor, partial [Candidatus Binataceae bacterium]
RRVHDMIVTVPCTPGPGCLFGSMAGNAGRVDLQGVEIVPSITPFKGLSFGGNVTILDETHEPGISSSRPLRVPKYSASSLLQYIKSGLISPRDRVVMSLNYTFVGDRDDITTASTIQNHAAYDTFAAVTSYAAGIRVSHIENEEVFVRFSNLFDRHYSEAFGFPAPPLNFVAGVKLSFE